MVIFRSKPISIALIVLALAAMLLAIPHQPITLPTFHTTGLRQEQQYATMITELEKLNVTVATDLSSFQAVSDEGHVDAWCSLKNGGKISLSGFNQNNIIKTIELPAPCDPSQYKTLVQMLIDWLKQQEPGFKPHFYGENFNLGETIKWLETLIKVFK